jgi:uncharacterized protein YjbI with pentapeptide repeats
MSEQSQTATAYQKRPAPEGYTSWPDYWKAHGMPWRTEPEIDEERQRYLAERQAITADVEKAIYPFFDAMNHTHIRLDRADVEWLLPEHHRRARRSTVTDGTPRPSEQQSERAGLDLRGATLQGADLRELPLAGLRAGLTYAERRGEDLQLREHAVVNLQGADLRKADLQGAVFSRAHCQDALFRECNLSRADFFWAQLQGVTFTEARLDGAHLNYAFLDAKTYFGRVILTSTAAGPCWLGGIRWGEADVSVVEWSQLKELGEERDARRFKAKPFTPPVARVSRRKVRTERNEHNKKQANAHVEAFQVAVRANRQVAGVLRRQGLNEDADSFSLRAQRMQRVVLRLQRRRIRHIGSFLLDLTSGYGYKPLRSLYTYIVTIAVFALLFWCVTNGVSLTAGGFTHLITLLGMSTPPPSTEHLQGYEAVVVSMTSFHGRGFFQPVQSPGDKVAILAAMEAFFGLLLEIVLIATFTQRFFAR